MILVNVCLEEEEVEEVEKEGRVAKKPRKGIQFMTSWLSLGKEEAKKDEKKSPNKRGRKKQEEKGIKLLYFQSLAEEEEEEEEEEKPAKRAPRGKKQQGTRTVLSVFKYKKKKVKRNLNQQIRRQELLGSKVYNNFYFNTSLWHSTANKEDRENDKEEEAKPKMAGRGKKGDRQVFYNWTEKLRRKSQRRINKEREKE